MLINECEFKTILLIQKYGFMFLPEFVMSNITTIYTALSVT